MQRATSIAPITSLQPPYSLLAREAEGEILPFAARNGIGVIVYSPMYSGLLSGKMTRERIAALSSLTTCGWLNSCAKLVFAMR
jgi:aryl-alcohol dehydrogenase-like predicted oxidoreductase